MHECYETRLERFGPAAQLLEKAEGGPASRGDLIRYCERPRLHDRSLDEPDCDWMTVVVHRGRHCPMCTRYLNQLEPWVAGLANIGVDVAAVSGDSAEQLSQHREKLNATFPLYHDLSVNVMQQLRLSPRRSPRAASADRR